MSRNVVFLLALVCSLTVGASVATASLVGYWNFNEGQGTVANDLSGKGHNGTITGTTPWVTGAPGFRGALQFGGANSGVDCGKWNPSTVNDPAGKSVSFTCWVNRIAGGNAYQGIVANRTGYGTDDTTINWALEYNLGANFMQFGSRTGTSYGRGALAVGQWIFLAVTFDGTTVRVYQNAGEASSGGAAFGLDKNSTVRIGNDDGGGGNAFNGVIDDVHMFDHILTTAEIAALMLTPIYETADRPNPANKAVDVTRDGVVLKWTPGNYAKTHDVYFGTSAVDVNTASTQNPGTVLVGKNQDANSLPLGRLELGTTYYWRVDEVNSNTSSSWKGDVWSFTVEPRVYAIGSTLGGGTVTATASTTAPLSSAQNTANGNGLTGDLHSNAGTAMWVSDPNNALTPIWIQYKFDGVYKLDSMWVWNYNAEFEDLIGIGVKGATVQYSTDGVNFTNLGDFTFTQAAGLPGYAHVDEVNFGGVAAQYVKILVKSNWGEDLTMGAGLSEVRFLYNRVQATKLVPANNATGINPTTLVLGWRAGRDVASHKVYIGTDPNALALVNSVATNSYAPTGLGLATRYYWRIDEVNTGTWPSLTLSFTTMDPLPVDNMESYNETTNLVYNAWVDGYGTTNNGAIVAYPDNTNGHTNLMERVAVHGGLQSMPFSYNNAVASSISEATRTFASAQDWSIGGALTLYVYGDPTNAAASLYVKINSTKIAYNGDAGDLLRHRWNPFIIDLATLPAATVKSVTKMTIGVSGAGTGKLFIDDILLSRVAPVGIPVAVDPAIAGGLMAWYAFNNNVQDSSGAGNNGTIVGTPTYVQGLAGYGTAMQFNGTTDCVALDANLPAFNPAGSFSVALWANIGAWGSGWGHAMMGNRGEGTLGWQIRRHSSTSLCFTTRGAGNDDFASVGAPLLNEWMHIGCVFDIAAKSKTIYFNGLQNNQVTAGVTGVKITATTLKTYIGARSAAATGGESFFTGMLDEIRVYNRALTGGEVAFLAKPTP